MPENMLMMPFIDGSESYVNGFETGQLWELLNNGELLHNRPCHISNKEQIKMMCDLLNCNYSMEDIDECWFYLNVKETKI